MTQHFNKLTPAEAERLAKLAEECLEVGVEICKILRHGYDSYHPAEPGRSNRQRLQDEVLDVLATVSMMIQAGDIKPHTADNVKEALARVRGAYMHHQERKA